MIDLKTDGHVHTKFCHHAVGEMAEYIEAAIEVGLARIIFLEHLEVGINYPYATWLNAEEFRQYLAAGAQLQEEYRGRIKVGLGVEVGYNPTRVDEILALLAGYAWDSIGISYHFMEIAGQHYNLVSRRPYNLQALGQFGVAQVVAAYLATLTEAVNMLPGTVVCHLDAVLRYHPDIAFNDEHMAQIDELLAVIAARDMAIEVNCSGYKMRGVPFPGLEIMRRAKSAGIRFAAGSDAHRPQDVGRYFDRLGEYCGKVAS